MQTRVKRVSPSGPQTENQDSTLMPANNNKSKAHDKVCVTANNGGMELESLASILVSDDRRQTGKGKRIAFYSHDTLGLGHLRRTLKIARGMTDLFPEISALIISGSPKVGLATDQLSNSRLAKSSQAPAAQSQSSAPKIDVVKLPSVKKQDDEKYVARYLPDDIERIVAMRSEIILGIIKTFEPHMLLVDHAPVGMRGELLPTFEWLNQKRGSTKLVYGMREIIDDSDKIQAKWDSEGIYTIMQDTYDGILIYGDPSLIPTADLYALPPAVREKTHYCGYIGDSDWRARAPQSERSSRASDDRKRVVVTIGGGDYYGPEIIGSYLKMLRENKATVDFDSVVITGPLLEPELFLQYKSEARDLPVTIHSSVERIPDVLCESNLLITTAGYNSAVDALSYARRTLMAPRISMRNEQVLRANALSDCGAVEDFDPQSTSPQELYERINKMLNQPTSPLLKMRKRGTIDLDGSVRAAAICGRLMQLTG